MEARHGAISIAKAANMHGVSKSTLRDRIHGAIPKIEASQNMQQLSPG
jgi:helix-turn-helix, Psq domain.